MKRPKLRAIAAVFNWKYLLVRATVVLAVVATVRCALDPVLRWALVTSGEAALGARVDVADLATSIRGGRMTIRRLAAANARKPMSNLFEAETIDLAIDVGQLLRKRVVIHGGAIDGIKFDSARADSGALPETPIDEATGPSMFDPWVALAGEGAGAWFDSLGGRLEEDLYSKLKTPALVDELRSRWPVQYAQLQARVEGLRSQARQIELEIRVLKQNPLRAAAGVAALQQQLTALDAQLRESIAQINALPEQAKADRAAVDAAHKHDEEFLRTQIQAVKADGDQLTSYLLGEEAHSWLVQSAEWVQFARKAMPQPNAKIKRAKERLHGVDVAWGPRRPKFLLERVALAGSARLNGQELAWAGELTDAASEPRLHGQPTRIRLAGTGALTCELRAELDRRGDLSHDRVEFDCPRLVLPARSLGKPDNLAVNLGPSDAEVHADVRLDGDQLCGAIRMRVSPSSIAAATPKIRDEKLSAAISESLAGAKNFAATVQLAGSLERPRWTVESDLGRQVAAGLEGAVARYVSERKEQLMAKVRGKVDEQLAELDAKRRQAQQELLGKLGESEQLVAQLASLTGGGAPLDAATLPRLGNSLSLDKFQR